MYAISVQAFKLSEHDAEDVFKCSRARTSILHKLRDDDAIPPLARPVDASPLLDRLRAAAPWAAGRLFIEPMEDVDDTIGALDEALAVRTGAGDPAR